MTRKKVAIVVLGIILLACLLVCGYFGAKTIRRSYQRRAAMAAYEKKNYKDAERLLRAYVAKDMNSEPELVALANIYHEFGDKGMEAIMWQMASALNPLKVEYRDNMMESALPAGNYSLLYGVLGQKVKTGEKLDDRELCLYLISACRSGHMKEGQTLYKKVLETNPEAFQKTELGQFAEFLVNYFTKSESERDAFLEQMSHSDDPDIRYEALYSIMRIKMSLLGGELATEYNEEFEEILKQLAEVNYYSGTPLLADYYFSLTRYADVIRIAAPYLKDISGIPISLVYLESCTMEKKTDAIKELKEKLQDKSGANKFLISYCDILTAYLEQDSAKLADLLLKSNKSIATPLLLFIRLKAALEKSSFTEIRTAAAEFFNVQATDDLRSDAVLYCLNYISLQMGEKKNQDDPSEMAELAQILMNHVWGNRLLTIILLVDKYKKGLLKEAELTAALEEYPDSSLLLRTAAEYYIFNSKPELAMDMLDQMPQPQKDGEAVPAQDFGVLFLRMLAIAQLGRNDEAAVIFKQLVESSDFNTDLLVRYFLFCVENKREQDLNAMADMLESSQDAKLKPYSVFFRAASLIVTGDEAKRDEALKMLAATPDDDPEMAFYAAVRLSEFDWLDEAEAKFLAIQKTYSNPALISLNLSEVYKAKGDEAKSLQAAKEGYEHGKSQLSAFVYAQRLADAGRYEEAVSVLNLPRRAGNYRADVIELWTSCMKKAIEKSIAEQRYLPAEEMCKHLLVIIPDDAFAKERQEFVHEKLFPKKDKDRAKEQ